MPRSGNIHSSTKVDIFQIQTMEPYLLYGLILANAKQNFNVFVIHCIVGVQLVLQMEIDYNLQLKQNWGSR